MKKFRIRTVCAALAAVMGLAVLAGCGSKSLDGTKVVSTVNENEIPLGVASFAMRYTQVQTEYYYSMFASMYGSESDTQIWDRVNDDGSTHGESTKEEILENLQKMYLVRDHAGEYGVDITDQEKEQIKEAAQEFIEGNEETLLTQMGVSQADVEEYLELETYYRKAEKPFIADVEIEVTDSEAAQSSITYSYRSIKNLEDDERETAKEELQELLDTFKQNEDIAGMDMKEAAEELSESFTTTTSSFGEDDTTLEDELKEAVEGLADGELYDGIIESDNTYYVVRMDKVLDEEATASKKETIKSERQQEAFDELVQGWLDDAKVSVEKKVWKQLNLTDKESYTMKLEDPEDEETEDADLVPEDALEDDLEDEEGDVPESEEIPDSDEEAEPAETPDSDEDAE